MSTVVDINEIELALRDVGSSWSAAQAHGLLCSRLAVQGRDGGADWIGQVLRNADSASDAHTECLTLMDSLYAETYQHLAERQSEFYPLLPDDSEPATVMADGLAAWCEGFLHGLVSDVVAEDLKKKLAAEPLSDIIKDMLEITRAIADDDGEADEEASIELIEYLRVATQLVYEELAELRDSNTVAMPESGAVH